MKLETPSSRRTRPYFTHLFNDQLKIDYQNQGVARDPDRIQVQIFKLLLIRAGRRLLQKAASLIANFDFKILIECAHHGGTHAPDVVGILRGADLSILKPDGALAGHWNGRNRDVKRIAHTYAAAEQVHRRLAAKAGGYLQTAGDGAQFRSFEISVLALCRLISPHVTAALFGKHLRGNHTFERGISDLKIRGKRVRGKCYEQDKAKHVTYLSMKYLGLFLLTVCILLAQTPSTKDEPEVKLANGKSQKDEIVRVDYERNLRDAGELARLSEEIKDDLEKGDRYLVSLKTLKQLEDVEKLSKDIRQRLRRN